MPKLYKYLAPSLVDRVFAAPESVSFKCSQPAQFNDPYELFLTIDFKQSAGMLAYYADVIGAIPQLPTTCFSPSPGNIPMWAHYAENHEGLVVELEEESVTNHNSGIQIGSVEYRDAPRDELDGLLERAFTLGKPRYIYMLQNSVFGAAYFTKATCWSYESERRLIAPEDSTRRTGDIVLLDLPRTCVTALICGARCSADVKDKLRQLSQSIGCVWLETQIGRSSAKPYFLDDSDKSFVAAGAGLEPAASSCDRCREPIAQPSTRCSWCQIGPEHRADAATRNTFRLLDSYDLLEDYIAGMQKIDRKAK